MQTSVVRWLDSRFPFTSSVDEAMYQRVPNYANAFYYCFGGMVFVLIALQILTGIFLALYYVPDAAGNPAPAYLSVQAIMNQVYLGWLVRGVHFWGAYLLVPLLVMHMARVFWTGSYRAPRELNWMVGVVLLLIVLAFALTGYLLPWDTKAYWATSVTIDIGASAPVLGPLIRQLAVGGPTLGTGTLLRFFTVHVFILPALVVLLMYVHFRLIRRHGISEPL
jgi:menaquinol-cytochrome c reductase cytochrome b subunit